MASQISRMAADGSLHAYQMSDAVPVQTDHLQPPLSPRTTVKKLVSGFVQSTSHHHGSQGMSRPYPFNRLSPFQVAHRVGVRLFFILAALLALFCWWRSGSVQELEALKKKANTLTKGLLLSPVLDGFHFTPANNQHIHYVGRWMHTPDQLRRDSSFPNAYLEFVVRNCSSVYASLHNTDLPSTTQEVTFGGGDTSEVTRLNFHPLSKELSAPPPVSLMTRIDNGEYTYFHKCANGLVAVTATALEPSEDHAIRVIAPGIDDEGCRAVEFEGLWLNTGASLASSPRTKRSFRPDMVSDALPVLSQKSPQYSGQSLGATGVKRFRSSGLSDNGFQQPASAPRKTLEIVTDLPRILGPQTENESLTALTGWEDLVGDMFGADHVHIALNGMCLTFPCIGGSSQSASVEDAFFRSGPSGSTSFARSWNFRSYIPDTLVLVLGNSDEASFRLNGGQYERTLRDLQRQFEDTYVRFIRSIRRAAYPLHPAAFHDYSNNADGFVYNSAPATIPIFVVSPFSGKMAHSTQKVVERLQSEGDKAVFWLDTSGWFSLADFEANIDGRSSDGRAQHLNSLGNRKAAVFFHAHLCHYMAEEQSRCPFLKHEAYTGQVYVPKNAELDKLIEESKTRKLKALFWPEKED